MVKAKQSCKISGLITLIDYYKRQEMASEPEASRILLFQWGNNCLAWNHCNMLARSTIRARNTLSRTRKSALKCAKIIFFI